MPNMIRINSSELSSYELEGELRFYHFLRKLSEKVRETGAPSPSSVYVDWLSGDDEAGSKLILTWMREETPEEEQKRLAKELLAKEFRAKYEGK